VLLLRVLIARTDVHERKCVHYERERERAYEIDINEREVLC